MQSKISSADEVPSRSPSAQAQAYKCILGQLLLLIPLNFNRVDNAIKNLPHRRGRFLREHPHLIFSATAMKLTPQRFSAQCKNTLIIAFLSFFHRSEQDHLGTLHSASVRVVDPK